MWCAFPIDCNEYACVYPGTFLIVLELTELMLYKYTCAELYWIIYNHMLIAIRSEFTLCIKEKTFQFVTYYSIRSEKRNIISLSK